jgi:hypothetical protein
MRTSTLLYGAIAAIFLASLVSGCVGYEPIRNGDTGIEIRSQPKSGTKETGEAGLETSRVGPDAALVDEEANYPELESGRAAAGTDAVGVEE